jgi:hypothetical protein
MPEIFYSSLYSFFLLKFMAEPWIGLVIFMIFFQILEMNYILFFALSSQMVFGVSGSLVHK